MSATNLGGYDYAISGAFAGMFTRLTCQPLDVLKIRFQLQTTPISGKSKESRYQSIYQAIRIIIQKEGVGALWKGHVSAQWLSIVYGAVHFSCYELVISHKKSSTWLHFAGGAISGCGAVLISFPFDIVRTRLVAQIEPKIYSGTIDATRKIIKNEGFLGLFRGFVPACLHVVPLSSVIFGFNHIFTNFWNKFIEPFNKDISIAGSAVCGSLAGLCGKTCVYPLDLLKKRMQMQGISNKKYSLLLVFLVTVRHEGYTGLFKGLMPSLIKAGVSNAVYFTSYNQCCQFIHSFKTQ